ncbi:MAG: hypothetical protein J7540_16290, partial [Roseofilum sp. SID2]
IEEAFLYFCGLYTTTLLFYRSPPQPTTLSTIEPPCHPLRGQPLLGLCFLYHDYHHYRRFLSKNGLLEASHAKHKESLSAFLDAYLY